MSAKSPWSKMFRLIASVMDALSEEEVDWLLSGRGKLVFCANEAARERPEPENNTDELLKQIDACKDREELRKVLAGVPNRDALATIARALRIHVVKGDRREDIENKIVEFVIGSKLRTDAIQTLNMKGGGESTQPGESQPPV